MATGTRRGRVFSDEESAAIARNVARLMAGESQLKFSKKTAPAIPQGRLSDLLNGKVRFTERTISVLAKALRVGPAVLLEGAPTTGNSGAAAQRSDPADTDLNQPIPRDMVEWLYGRGEEDEVRFFELIDILQARNYPAQADEPRGAEYYEIVLGTVRSMRASPRAR